MAIGRRDARIPIVTAALAAVAMVAQAVGAKATRDALFLSHYPATMLPRAMVGAAALSILGVYVTSRLLTRFGPARVVPAAFALSGALFFGEFFLMKRMPTVGVVSVYLHVAVFGAVVVSGFWSVVNERFDPHTAKKAIGRIATGATFGGVVGGVAAERVASMADTEMMLVLLAVLNVLAGVGVARVGGGASTSGDGSDFSAIGILRRESYLRDLGLLITFVAVTSALIDYTFKAEAAHALVEGDQLMRFFAIFYTATGVLTFLVQSGASRPALKRLGLTGTIAFLPIAVLAAGGLGAALTRLWTVTLLRAAESIFSNSLFRSAYELLYTPVAPKKKRATKAFIDVVCDKAGDAVGGGLVMLVLAIASVVAHKVLIGLAVAGAAGALFIALRLHRGYVAQLAESLRKGSVKLDEEEVVDATTRQTLAETAVAVDRDQLLAEIERMRQLEQQSSPSEPSVSAEPKPYAGFESLRSKAARITDRPPDADDLLKDVADLMSGSLERVILALRKRPVDPRIVAHVVPLLAQDAAVKDATKTLREIAPRVEGQLVDTLLDKDTPFIVRRRLPGVLRTCDSQRAADGLFAALEDERFEVRFRAGQALSQIAERNPKLRFDGEAVFQAAERELEVNEKVWEDYRALEEESEDLSPLIDDVLRQRMHRSLQHVFSVLSLHLDRDVLQISLRALFSGDPGLRGTALEYLENVLAPAIRKRLWPRIGVGQRVSKPPSGRRSHTAIVEDLFKSSDSIEIDLDKLGIKKPQGGGA